MKIARKIKQVQKVFGIHNPVNERTPARRKLTKEDKFIAQRIKQLRKARGLTQEELSEILAMNTSYITQVEAGHQGLSLPMIYLVTKIFHLSLKDFFSFENT
jgi:Predicted transcriptional regulators